MTILRYRIGDLEEAISAVLASAGVEGLTESAVELFVPSLEQVVSRQEVEKVVNTAVKERYGKQARGETLAYWLVPVPQPSYQARAAPTLLVEVTVYLVASAMVRFDDGARLWYGTLVQPVGKPQITALPLSFLMALLDQDEGRYRKVGKQGRWTWRELPGLKQPLRLHDDLVSGLRHTFKLKPVVDWLDDFGRSGHSLAPLVAGAIFGLRYRGAEPSLPLEQQPPTREDLVRVITSLGYGNRIAERVVELAEPELRTVTTLAEAVPIVLKYVAKEV